MKKVIGLILLLVLVFGCAEFLVNKANNGKYFDEGFTKNQVENIENTVQKTKVLSNKSFQLNGIDNVNGLNATYIKNVDGNTIVIQIGTKEEKIKLLNVNAPEIVKIGTPVEPYGPQAKDFITSKIKSGSTIQLAEIKKVNDEVLAYVYYNDAGKWYNLNEELIANGLARVTSTSSSENKFVNQMYEAENSAKEQKLNIWSISDYVTNKGYNLNVVAM